MEDIDELMKSINSVMHKASTLSSDLANFICMESTPLGEVVNEWLCSRNSYNANITLKETERLIKQRRIATWQKAKRQFGSRELAILADWQTLEAKALTLSINIILRNPIFQEQEP